METYFKLKIFFEYIAPICILVGLALVWIGLSIVISVSEKKRKGRGKKRNGKVRKEDDAV